MCLKCLQLALVAKHQVLHCGKIQRAEKLAVNIPTQQQEKGPTQKVTVGLGCIWVADCLLSLHEALTARLKKRRSKLNLTSTTVPRNLHPGALLAVIRQQHQAKKALMTSALHPSDHSHDLNLGQRSQQLSCTPGSRSGTLVQLFCPGGRVIL